MAKGRIISGHGDEPTDVDTNDGPVIPPLRKFAVAWYDARETSWRDEIIMAHELIMTEMGGVVFRAYKKSDNPAFGLVMGYYVRILPNHNGVTEIEGTVQ